jgi:crotonobetainyl-CoA:carnitine CoA-transferase CaiB-like acyl-CoA transferase
MAGETGNGGRGALEGTLVVEWGAGRAAAYAGKLLRGLGAEVVLLEQAGERERAFDPGPVPAAAAQLDARMRFLHGGKRSVAFDAARAGDRARLETLLSRADVFITDRPMAEAEAAGLAPETLAGRFPTLVTVAITLAGLQGEERYWRYSDLVAMAIGGVAAGTPARVPDPATYPPLKPGGHQADYTCGLHAATGALLGLQLRRRTGRGEVVDVSAQAIFASYVRMDIAYRTYNAVDSMSVSPLTRQSPTGRFSTIWGLVPCKDGYFAFQASEQYQWEGLMRAMGNPEWSKDSRFQEPLDRVAYWDEIEPHFIAYAAEHTKAEIFHRAQAEHVPVFPCYTVEELVADEQQVARAFFVDLPAGDSHNLVKVPAAVVHLERTPWRPSFEPPAVGADTEALLGREPVRGGAGS